MKRAVYAANRQNKAGQRKRYVPRVVLNGPSCEPCLDPGAENLRALMRLKVGRVARISSPRAPAAVMTSKAKAAWYDARSLMKFMTRARKFKSELISLFNLT